MLLVGGAVIGFYDGLAGPGTGSFLVFALVGLVGFAFLAASASAKVVNAATNVGALMFLPAGVVFAGPRRGDGDGQPRGQRARGAAGRTPGSVFVRRGRCSCGGVGVRAAGSVFVRRVFLVVVLTLVLTPEVRSVVS